MTTDEPWTRQPQTEQDLVLDGPSLRALAHPVRVEIVGLLRRGGSSTASLLAERLGLNSGATSYHLRQLAEAGLIDEDAERGNKRERWWRAKHRSTYFESGSYEADPEAAVAYFNAVATDSADRMIAFANLLPGLDEQWRDASTMSDYRLRLTPHESRELQGRIQDVVAGYRRDDDVADGSLSAPDDAVRVDVQVQIMPAFDDE